MLMSSSSSSTKTECAGCYTGSGKISGHRGMHKKKQPLSLEPVDPNAPIINTFSIMSSSSSSTKTECAGCYTGSGKISGHRGMHKKKRPLSPEPVDLNALPKVDGRRRGRVKKRSKKEIYNIEKKRWEKIGPAGLLEPTYFQPEDLPMVATEVSEASVLAALETVSIPKTLRLNTKLHAKDQKYGMCLGAIKTYGYGVRSSMATVSRPNLTNLLVCYMKQAKPDFKFTSIQVNKNYLSALHVDSNNMGPSFIVGFGNYIGGEVWQQGLGACDVNGKIVDMDGNMPHATLPFAGCRYTLVYFSHQSWKKAPELARLKLKNIHGFPLPSVDMVMADYGNKEDRLRQGKRLYNQFKLSKACPPAITKEQRQEKEMNNYHKRISTLRVKEADVRQQFQQRFNKEWKRLKLSKNSRIDTVQKFCENSELWPEMVEATLTRGEMIQMIQGVR
jgi:hypothetical protein